MKFYFLLSMLLSMGMTSAMADTYIQNDIEDQSWYLQEYKDKFPASIAKLTEKDLEDIFEVNDQSQYCESTIIQKIVAKFGRKNLIPVLMQSRKLDLIDDVVLDILFPIAFKYGNVEVIPKDEFRLDKGADALKTHYSALFKDGCAVEKIAKLESIVSKKAPEGFMTYLHGWAKDKMLISQEEYYLANALTDNKSKLSNLRVKDYASKREKLRQLLSERPEKGNLILGRKGKLKDLETGQRYQLYASFSITQIKTLSKVMERLNQRIMSDRSEITFITKDQVQEKIELGPMEQVKLSLKIYQREKKLIQLEEDLKGKPITYQQLLTLSFELRKITNKDLEYLSTFPHLWDKKKSILEKVRDFTQEYGFIVPLVAGPTTGYAFLIGVTILDNYVENDLKRKNMLGDFTQDLFYGSCDAKAL